MGRPFAVKMANRMWEVRNLDMASLKKRDYRTFWLPMEEGKRNLEDVIGVVLNTQTR